MNQSINPSLLEYSWTAEVKLKNNQIITIWYTAWHSCKHIISEILSISTDLPKHKIIKKCQC